MEENNCETMRLAFVHTTFVFGKHRVHQGVKCFYAIQIRFA